MRIFCTLLFLTITGTGITRGAEPAGHVSYVGGTIQTLEEGAGGSLRITDARVLTVTFGKKETEIPYDSVNLLEYGQKSGRRIGTAVAAYALLGPAGTLVLLSKSRRHFVTIGFRDADNHQQAMVLRLDKRRVRAVLASLEARTGLRVTYQDDESRKGGKG